MSRLVQIEAAERVRAPAGEGQLQPVGVIGNLEMPVAAAERIFRPQQQDRLQRPLAQHVHLPEGIAVLHNMGFAGQEVDNGPGRCIPRHQRHPGESEGHVGGPQAAGPFPGAGIGAPVAGRGVRPGGGEGEDESPAAVAAIAQAQEVPAEPVAPGAALHVRTAYVEDAHIGPAGGDEGVQFPQKKIVGRRAPGGPLQDVAVIAHEGVMRAGGKHRHKE